MQSPHEERERDCGGMRDDMYGSGIRIERFRRFQHWRAQPRIRPLFGGEGEVDNCEVWRFARQLESFPAGSRRSGEEDGARIGERVLVERFDHGGLIAQTRECAFLIFLLGNEA